MNPQVVLADRSSVVPVTKSQVFTIGVDIGGTNSEIGFVDRDGRCIYKTVLATLPDQPFRTFIEQFVRLIQERLRALAPEYRCVGMGVAAPGAGSREGLVSYPTNIGWTNIDFAAELAAFFNFPVRVVNDADAAALGEKRYGAARQLQNFIVLTLGTGLGGGIFVEGELLMGARGYAGEFGHVNVRENGRLCGCGKRGCLETYVSATGLRRTVLELVAEYGNKSGRFASEGFQSLTARRIWEAAREGDPLACEAFRRTGAILGRMISDLVPIFDPEAVILFGGLTKSGRYLLEPTQQAFEESLAEIYRGRIPLLLSEVPNDEAAILGASCLIDVAEDH